MKLRDSLFWDTDVRKLNWETHAKYVIERVMHRGTWNEFKQIVAYYGKEKITDTVKRFRYLDQRVLHFCSVYFSIPLTKFRCYNIKQPKKAHWNY